MVDIFFILTLIVFAAAALLFFWQRSGAADYGPPVVLCPGPDLYGYTCENSAAYAYIDATNDTFLYVLDGTIKLNLPFAFTFYGTTYTELFASSNGNIQFGNASPEYRNSCLDTKPAAGMGDMVAPYWDDLDLRFEGYLETEVVGEAPNRIFVVEWDAIPRYETGDPLTFEVQLFEGSHDIVFLYQDVAQGAVGNGRSATIGIQSELQGLALQLGCNLAMVADAGQVRFTHPEQPNGEVGLAGPLVEPDTAVAEAALKGPAADLLRQLNMRGEGALTDLNRQWLAQTPPVTAVWQRTDMTGDGLPELILLRHSTRQYPSLAQVIVLTPDGNGQWELLLDRPLSSRQQLTPNAAFAYTGDLTQDGIDDVLLVSADTGQLFVLTAVYNRPTLTAVPDTCYGDLAVLDVNNDGHVDIVRDGCERDGRVYTIWNGQSFNNIP
ncbi:MAG TPA: VCBS repeat-containing protein [Chloroflexota bacterium]|nr:VCBS repeat-containing protein [Chloroflexota bacterium]HUM72081.1 VCBS repeat-containing protein [Chloroflexota bacterium]